MGSSGARTEAARGPAAGPGHRLPRCLYCAQDVVPLRTGLLTPPRGAPRVSPVKPSQLLHPHPCYSADKGLGCACAMSPRGWTYAHLVLLFSFSLCSLEGTPVNRIPIMAKQVLDLYTLYRLVTDKGGLVEVINKKIWREITKGLNLPTSITSAAFTLRTQYMKYLYPYECEKRALSSPGELQAAIDSNRREGRRQTFGTALFNYSPTGTPTLLGSPKMPLPGLSISTHSCSQIRVCLYLWGCSPFQSPPRAHHHCGEDAVMGRSGGVQLTSPYDRQETALNLSTNGISSINMSIEINGVVYTGK
uniref:AT-rich interactive domain-containing protein 3 n=1 Tax=Meleagris gallopavo TaxID=9103 RepID=G1MWP3_MELGA